MEPDVKIIGPLRHPRPLTAADLHLELEKEQEAVVCVLELILLLNLANFQQGQSLDKGTLTPSTANCFRCIDHILDFYWS
jgi:hypothetical protein